MKKESMFEIVKRLPFDTQMTVYNDAFTELYLYRPSKLSKRFAHYDVTKNFQIWIKENDRVFRPNHLRVFLDLNLRVRSRPDLKERLLIAFDNIYYGSNPDIELDELAQEHFDHFLNNILIIGYLAQLFVIEQEYNYVRESKYDPPTLFFQGWIRQFIDSPKEIDNLCMSVARGQPPQRKYTRKENKKHKAYQATLDELWYLH